MACGGRSKGRGTRRTGAPSCGIPPVAKRVFAQIVTAAQQPSDTSRADMVNAVQGYVQVYSILHIS
jgi:hypothetical protein